MITLLACECGSSEQLIRQALHKYEYKNWAMQPIFKGKTKCLSEVERLIRENPEEVAYRALFSHINGTGKWCVILGHDKKGARWSDISHHDMKSDVDAELIVADFS